MQAVLQAQVLEPLLQEPLAGGMGFAGAVGTTEGRGPRVLLCEHSSECTRRPPHAAGVSTHAKHMRVAARRPPVDVYMAARSLPP